LTHTKSISQSITNVQDVKTHVYNMPS